MVGSVNRIKEWARERVAAAHIAGPHIDDALRICQKARQLGWYCIICPWNARNDTPQAVASSYLLALNSIVREQLDCYLSIKPPALQYNLDALRVLLEVAGEYGIRVHFDAQEPDSAVPSFALLERALTVSRNVGCTLPSRWRRSISDARRAIDLGVPVRVVKGEWPDPAEPRLDARVHFLDLVDLLAGGAAHVGVATHDSSLARESLLRLQKTGTSCQLEQLCGLPSRADSVASPLGVSVRVYIPYGHARLPYFLSQIPRRPIIAAWATRDFVLGAARKL